VKSRWLRIVLMSVLLASCGRPPAPPTPQSGTRDAILQGIRRVENGLVPMAKGSSRAKGVPRAFSHGRYVGLHVRPLDVS
jgi:hypothetical protein